MDKALIRQTFPGLLIVALFLAGCGSSGSTPTDNGQTDTAPDSGTPCGGSCDDNEVCFEGRCCEPFCLGRVCGSDGCGGSCGECGDGQTCFEGFCCTPSCNGKECGDDGCGGTCGNCGDDLPCSFGKCCVPVCGDAVCGEDSCGRPTGCGTCGDGFACLEGQCCKQKCSGRECGDDGCGGVCGECVGETFCENGTCRPSGCEGRWCGTGTGGVDCGSCESDQVCWEGNCCRPDCSGKICGSDGCGGSCGVCEGDQVCCFEGTDCCPASCEGRVCGPDGFGGYCGPDCGIDGVCLLDGTCCEPDCSPVKICGDDGCGGTCGTCQEGNDCLNGFCTFTTGECPNGFCEKCDPASEDCEGIVSEGCTNCPADCGCESGFDCVNNKCCHRNCGTRQCGINDCGETCGFCGHGAVCNASGMCDQCNDPCTPGLYCTQDGTSSWECVYAKEGCNVKKDPVACQFGCAEGLGICMNECPATHGKCSAPGSYKCFSDAPQCVFMCPADPSIPSSARYWTTLLNCSASGDICECAEFGDISTCMRTDAPERVCVGQRIQ